MRHKGIAEIFGSFTPLLISKLRTIWHFFSPASLSLSLLLDSIMMSLLCVTAREVYRRRSKDCAHVCFQVWKRKKGPFARRGEFTVSTRAMKRVLRRELV